jgi:hypothetical protein
MSKEPGVFSEYIAPPLVGAGAGGLGGAALGAAGGYAGGSLREVVLRHLGKTNPAGIEAVIKTLPPKTKAVLLGALLTGAPAALGGLVGGLSRNTDPYAARTAGGIAGGLGGLGLGYLMRVPGSPISSLLAAMAMGGLGAAAGGMAGLGVGAARKGKAEQRIRQLLEEARVSREGLKE